MCLGCIGFGLLDGVRMICGVSFVCVGAVLLLGDRVLMAGCCVCGL